MGKNIEAGGAYVRLGVKDQLDEALSKIQGKLNSFAKKTTAIGAGVSAAGASILGPLLGAAKVFADFGAPLDDISKRTGVGAGKLSAYQFAAEQSGTSIEALETALGKMVKTLYAADEESKGAVDSLADLGLGLEELEGLRPDQQFEKIADALSRVEDPGKKAALAMQLFGKSGTELLPMIEDGAKGLADMVAQGEALGVVLSDEAIASAAALDDTFVAFWATLKGVTVQIGAAVAGPLTSFLQAASAMIGTVSKWISENQSLIVAIGAVGLGLVTIGTVIASAGVAAAALSAGIGAVGAALAAITSPIGLVIAGVTGVVVGLATLTSVFDPVVNYLSEGFDWLSGVFEETLGGIKAALGSGDLAAAAQIAFTGLRLVISKTLESVLSIFGTTIDEMSQLLAELYKKIGTVVAYLNETRATWSHWLAERGGDLIGVEVLEGDNVDLQNARRYSQAWQDVDTKGLSEVIANALDPAALQEELDKLVAEAKAGADEIRAEKERADRAGFKGIDPTAGPSLDLEKAVSAMPKNFGGFSAAALNRQIAGPKDFAKDTAKNTAETVDQLEEVVRLLPTLAMRFS